MQLIAALEELDEHHNPIKSELIPRTKCSEAC